MLRPVDYINYDVSRWAPTAPRASTPLKLAAQTHERIRAYKQACTKKRHFVADIVFLPAKIRRLFLIKPGTTNSLIDSQTVWLPHLWMTVLMLPISTPLASPFTAAQKDLCCSNPNSTSIQYLCCSLLSNNSV